VDGCERKRTEVARPADLGRSQCSQKRECENVVYRLLACGTVWAWTEWTVLTEGMDARADCSPGWVGTHGH